MAQAQLSRSHLLTTFFRNPEYLSVAPLSIDNVMPYFYDSPFFERSSNNGQLAMQATGQGTMITQKAMDESLRGLVGIEFAVVHARPPGLFVIHKRYRKSPEEVRPITAYYVLNGNINQAPDLHELIGNRLISTISSLRNSLSLARAAAMGGPVQNSEGSTVHRPGAAFNVRWGHGWRLNDSVDQPEEKEDDEDEDEEERQEKENPEEQKGEEEEDPAVQSEKEKEKEQVAEKIEEQVEVEKIPEKVVGKKGKRSRDDEDSAEPSNISTNTKQRRTAASSEKKRRTAR